MMQWHVCSINDTRRIRSVSTCCTSALRLLSLLLKVVWRNIFNCLDIVPNVLHKAIKALMHILSEKTVSSKNFESPCFTSSRKSINIPFSIFFIYSCLEIVAWIASGTNETVSFSSTCSGTFTCFNFLLLVIGLKKKVDFFLFVYLVLLRVYVCNFALLDHLT